jgi:hypothetical protein
VKLLHLFVDSVESMMMHGLTNPKFKDMFISAKRLPRLFSRMAVMK